MTVHFKKESLRNPIAIYCGLSIAALTALLACLLVTHGELSRHYFFYDGRDMGMDFFHSIECVSGRAPYTDYNVVYPPLANLLFYCFYRLIPKSVSSVWPSSFSDLIAMRGTEFDQRTFQEPLLLFVFYTIVVSMALSLLIMAALRDEKSFQSKLVAACMLFSFGVMYAIERGNIILLSLFFVLVFVLYRNSNNRFFRELSLVSLAISAALKLYPALFGLLLLKDKRFLDSARCAIYCIALIVLPAFFFSGGLGSLLDWVNAVLGFRTDYSSSNLWVGLDLGSILGSVSSVLQANFGIQIMGSLYTPITLLVVILVALCVFFSDSDWQRVFAISLAIVLIRWQAVYILSFFTVPLVLFLREEKNITLSNAIPFVSLLLLVVPMPIFYTWLETYPQYAIFQFALVIGAIWCIINVVIGVKQRLVAKRRAKN